MAFKATSIGESRAGEGRRNAPRLGWRILVVLFLLQAPLLAALPLAMPNPARAQATPVKGEIFVTASGGYARLLFKFAEDVESKVRADGSVVVITFKRPIDISVDRISSQAPDYVSAARRDPNGLGVRLALARKVTVNSMAAGERLFVDLLPEGWNGLPPGLPQEVIEELARRAREAEKKAKQQQLLARQRKLAPIRVQVATEPTFTRYVFKLPGAVGVSTDRGKNKLLLLFDASIKYDLADARAALPPVIESIDSELDDDTTSVRFTLLGKVDLRTFRDDDNNFVVDVVTDNTKKPNDEKTVKSSDLAALAAAKKPVPPKGVAASATVPAKVETKPPATPAAAPQKAPPVAPAIAAAKRRTEAPAAMTAAKAKPAIVPPVRDPNAPVVVETAREHDRLLLTFPFAGPTPVAFFRRTDTAWLVFDTQATIDLSALQNDTSRIIRDAKLMRADGAQVVRIKLERPLLLSLSADGPSWVASIGESMTKPTKPLGIGRNVVGSARASISIPFEQPQKLHRIKDPEIGDTLMVVTALAPARGFLKTQDFVELAMLASTQGVVIQPRVDDLDAELSVDKIVLGRPSGLTLSSSIASGHRSRAFSPLVFDSQSWGFNRQANFLKRSAKLITDAAMAPPRKRLAAHLDLARFYLARDMYAEAKGALSVVIGEHKPIPEDTSALVLRGIANILMDRPEEGLKDLASPLIGNQFDAPLWRAYAHARQGKWVEAREGFKGVERALGALPIELQRRVLAAALRASIEVHDFAGAAKQLNEFELIGVSHELEPTVSVLSGRLAEGLGRNEDALNAYRTAADSWDRRAAAEGRLRELMLRYHNGDAKRAEVIAALETLTTIWRGDETEVEALQLLAHLYTEEHHFRQAFNVMRTALLAHPNSDLTRRIHDEAAKTFDALFLEGAGDALPAIDALGLFYDFRELTPIGRRGDEMIRRLADRLVSVDLLDQAAELLQHQVDHRLQGAARAQVATRLAVIYLMNRKPDKALATLRATRTAELTTDLRNQRLLIEGRALSDIGRHDLALEVIANVKGREAIRLRSDIYWAARRWRKAAEQLELLYGERWKDFRPLSDVERSDILRAAIGYALGEDALGLQRFREKYAPKMAEGPDRRAFEVVSAPLGTSGDDFRDVARMIAAVDTLDGFLREMRARYPESAALSPEAPPAVPSANKPQTPAGSTTPPAKPGKVKPEAARPVATKSAKTSAVPSVPSAQTATR
jgi:tetratricopeptide (TPR) repeat protein